MLKDIAPKPESGKIGRARTLRRDMSLPEVLLWRILKTRPHGLKFRRQHPSGRYIIDFYCNDARLAVEVDGRAHEMGSRPARDAERDVRFAVAGIETLRIAATDVLQNPTACAENIVACARARLPLHHPAAPDGPPPRDELGKDL